MKNPFFTIWIMFWNIFRLYFLLLAYNTLRTILRSFFSNLHFSVRKCIAPQLYLFIKCLILILFADSFLFLHDLTWMLHYIESIYYVFYWLDFLLLFLFLFNQENLFIIHHNLQLFYEFYDTTNEVIENKITTFHWFS